MAVISLIAGVSWSLLAMQRVQGADSDDATGTTPTPSPAHTHRHHPKHSPSPSTTAGDDSDVTPSPKPRKHRLPGDDSDAATPAPTAAPDSDNTEASPTPKPHRSVAPDASLDSDQLEDFSEQPKKIRDLIETCLQLTRQNLTYTYSSADPANGGMDCSGFIYYVLTQSGLKDVPRDASEQYIWVRKANNFRAVISRNLDGFELDELKPGDLLFWIGTYDIARDPPVTHTMLYLGREKGTGNRVMVGSSDGRTYRGQERWGVSVFDFKAAPPAATSSTHPSAQFIGYGAVPGF
jgi:cell wall-associated NlpC family hydrolase